MIKFTDKKYLITGGSSGIGKEIAIQLSNYGAKVVLLARDIQKIKETFSLLKGDGHHFIIFNLEKTDGIKEMLLDVVNYDNKPLDGFVHCAGIPSIFPLKMIDNNKFSQTLNINTYSYFEILKYFGRKSIVNDNAAVVYLSSILTKYPKKAQSLYISSKSAAQSVSKVLSLELIKRKTRINTVIIGSVLTQMVEDTEIFRELKAVTNVENLEESKNNTTKILTTKEVSNMVLFLLSDSAKYIIGEEYYIDGGVF